MRVIRRLISDKSYRAFANATKIRFGAVVVSCIVAPVALLLSPLSATAIQVSYANPAMNVPGYSADPLGLTTQSIGEVGMLSFPSNFVSVSENAATSSITVYVTSSTLQMIFTLRSLSTLGSINFVVVPSSRSALDAMNNNVTQSWQALQDAGVTMTIWHPELLTGKEYIGVANLTSDQLAIIQQMFGPSTVDVQNLTPDQVPVSTSRTYDTAPWDGGDNLHDTTTNADCSAGFGVTVNGTKELLTAAHCFASGDQITNALGATGSQLVVGYVGQRDLVWTGTDTELIPTNASNQIQTGYIGAPTMSYVNGWASNPAGYQVCQSGAFSGALCGITIASDTVYGDPGTCLLAYVDGQPRISCHLIHANAAAGQIANQAGDSGGPVYRFIGSSLAAVGIVSSSTPGNTVPCVYNATTCFNDLYYTSIDSTLAKWGASLNTH
jgi:hypothetical protein